MAVAMTIIVVGGVAIVGCRGGSSSTTIPTTERSFRFGGVDAHHDDDDDEINVDHEAIQGCRARAQESIDR